jgi:hypothetical protein
MQIRRSTGLLVLSLMTAFFLAACGGGGGGDSAPDLTPVATTVPANSITSNGAVLNAIVNPKGLSTTAWFEYSKDPALVSNVFTTTPQVLGSGSTDSAINQIITGLESGQTYSFRVTATNSGGTKKGATFTLSTLPLPSVTTNPATLITTTGATLNANVNPNGRETYAWFEYGETASFGTTIDNVNRGSGTVNVAASTTLTGLKVATQYYFRLVAASSAGTANGTILNFTTAGGAPTATTIAVDPGTITAHGAVLKADVNPSALPTFAWFEYGTTPSLGTVIDNVSRGSGSSNVSINTPLSGLLFNTQYYYRVVATNSVGTTNGGLLNFTTLNPPPTANAGTDQSVYTRSATGATVVTLDASGSSTDPSKEITTYAWTQLSGTTVTLDDDTLQTPSFTAPALAYADPSLDLVFEVTVTDNTGLSATDNVMVTVNWGFLDDFSTDTTATYTPSGTGSLSYDAVNEKARVITGAAGNTFTISHLFSFGVGNFSSQGVFSFDLLPTLMRAGSGVAITIGDSANTYIRLSTLPGEDVVVKYRNSVLIDSQPLTGNPTLNINNPVTITFTGSVTTVEAFGQTVTLGGGSQLVPMAYFSVTATGMDALYDNFKLEIHP